MSAMSLSTKKRKRLQEEDGRVNCDFQRLKEALAKKNDVRKMKEERNLAYQELESGGSSVVDQL